MDENSNRQNRKNELLKVSKSAALLVNENDNSIATIAKQISDHAEIIYQTWKSSGLSPSDILSCSDQAGIFDETLSSPPDIRLDSLNLIASKSTPKSTMENFVSSFINQDKARQLVHKRETVKNILTSGTIERALKKFEVSDRNDNFGASPDRIKGRPQKDVVASSNATPSVSKSEKNAATKKKDNTKSSTKSSKESALLNLTVDNQPAVINNKSSPMPIEHCDRIATGEHVSRNCSGWEKPGNTIQIHIGNSNTKSNIADLSEYNKICNSLSRNSDKLSTNSKVQSDKKKSNNTAKGTANTGGNISGHQVTDSNSGRRGPVLGEPSAGMELMQAATAPDPTAMPAPTKLKLRLKGDNNGEPQERSTSNIYCESNFKNNKINPVRPFLTRGSVAERVLMFEKCPDIRNHLRNINPEAPKSVPKYAETSDPELHTTLQRQVRSSTKSQYIPRFYFPHGKPQQTIAVEKTLRGILSAFDSFPSNQVTKVDLPKVLKICGLPFYWRVPILLCTQNNNSGLVEGQRFIDFWKQMSVYCHDAASRFVYILSKGQRYRTYILPEDLAPLVQDVVDTHPGLAFLKEATEFHSRYVHTVVARIFYTVNRSWSGRITVSELRRSNLLQIIHLLEEEEDINQIMAFFSYEHFYVIYCKFWELDRDHDLLIDQNDLEKHSDHALSTRIIERVFSGCVTKNDKKIPAAINKMTYTEFVWFLLSEEDKTSHTAIEYWFRCMDLDGDGILSMYELEYFYEEQQQRMESIGIETLPYEDCLCQMLDMIKPMKKGLITLRDLKACKLTPIFFDTFFNLEKYLDHEQRDPFATQRDNDYVSDWDKYAAQEYELLVAEDGNDHH